LKDKPQRKSVTQKNERVSSLRNGKEKDGRRSFSSQALGGQKRFITIKKKKKNNRKEQKRKSKKKEKKKKKDRKKKK